MKTYEVNTATLVAITSNAALFGLHMGHHDWWWAGATVVLNSILIGYFRWMRPAGMEAVRSRKESGVRRP